MSAPPCSAPRSGPAGRAAAGLPFTAVVIGCSAGGVDALRRLLGPLPATFPLPILVAAHVGDCHSSHLLVEALAPALRLPIAEAWDKTPLRAGWVHVAPGGYHLLVEAGPFLALSTDPRVCNVRPAADVLFESAAMVFGPQLLALVLTGGNQDGAHGLRVVRAHGGTGLVQDPASALVPVMPEAAIAGGGASRVLTLEAMTAFLQTLNAGTAVVLSGSTPGAP